MYCKHCGKEVADDVAFCPHCGGALKAEEKKMEKEPLIKQESIDKAKETAKTINWKEPDFLDKINKKTLTLTTGIVSVIALILGVLFTIMSYTDIDDFPDFEDSQITLLRDLASAFHVLLIIGLIVMILIAIVVVWKYLSKQEPHALFFAGSSLVEAITLGLQLRYVDWIKRIMDVLGSLEYYLIYSVADAIDELFEGSSADFDTQLRSFMPPSGLYAILMIIVALVTIIASTQYEKQK